MASSDFYRNKFLIGGMTFTVDFIHDDKSIHEIPGLLDAALSVTGVDRRNTRISNSKLVVVINPEGDCNTVRYEVQLKLNKLITELDLEDCCVVTVEDQ
jgi:hypothetical protein